MYYVYRSTTDKLNEAFQKIEEAGDLPLVPPQWLGSRDWIIFVRKMPDPARAEEQRERDFEELFGERK